MPREWIEVMFYLLYKRNLITKDDYELITDRVKIPDSDMRPMINEIIKIADKI